MFGEMSSIRHSSSPLHWSRWSPSILAWPQSGQTTNTPLRNTNVKSLLAVEISPIHCHGEAEAIKIV
ncbi:hypothetical protein TNCV_3043091 [Trichonephila clavipes]|nr:hypothetical protein TNCV_3043091 [Trichonephila clavipes]